MFGWNNTVPDESLTCVLREGLLAQEATDDLGSSDTEAKNTITKSYALEDGLWREPIGGIARIDVKRRAIAYFTDCGLSKDRVTSFALDQEAVWIETKDKRRFFRLDRKTLIGEQLWLPWSTSVACSTRCISVTAEAIIVDRAQMVDVWNGSAVLLLATATR